MLKSLDRSIRSEESEMIKKWITFWQESEFGPLRSSVFDECRCFLVVLLHFHWLRSFSACVFPIRVMMGCRLGAHNWIELNDSHFMNWCHLGSCSLVTIKRQRRRNLTKKNSRKRDGIFPNEELRGGVHYSRSYPQPTNHFTRTLNHKISQRRQGPRCSSSHSTWNPPITTAIMSLRKGYEQAPEATRAPQDESDAEEEALAEDYREQLQFDDGLDDMERTASLSAGPQDIYAQLTAAATPLEFQATLDTKFASYDNYCSLFHYILNSDGPVDLDVQSVRWEIVRHKFRQETNKWHSSTGLGM